MLWTRPAVRRPMGPRDPWNHYRGFRGWWTVRDCQIGGECGTWRERVWRQRGSVSTVGAWRVFLAPVVVLDGIRCRSIFNITRSIPADSSACLFRLWLDPDREGTSVACVSLTLTRHALDHLVVPSHGELPSSIAVQGLWGACTCEAIVAKVWSTC